MKRLVGRNDVNRVPALHGYISDILSSSSHQRTKVGISTPTSQVRELRIREGRLLVHCHTASKRQLELKSRLVGLHCLSGEEEEKEMMGKMR